MKYFLFLAAIIGFLPVLIMKAKGNESKFKELLTELTSVQENIVALHNTIRRNVLPTAKNMLKMSWRKEDLEKQWSKEVAQNAKEVSKYCKFSKSDILKRRILGYQFPDQAGSLYYQNVEHQGTFCGENIHVSSHLMFWSDVINIWYNESQYFRYGLWATTSDDIITEHYTQIIWATTYLVGCSVTTCDDNDRELTLYLYVCQYCHEGNEPEEILVPYKAGNPCEDCPMDCEAKLCTNPCPYYDENKDCDELKENVGCEHPLLYQLCKATCVCEDEIK